MTKEVTLAELVIESKDGDWGKDTETEGLTPYRVIRGADFPSARKGNVSTVPLRFIPERTASRRTLRSGDIIIETAGGTRDRPTGRTLRITSQLLHQLDRPATCASFARFVRIDNSKADPAFIFWYLQYLHQTGEMWQHQVQHTGVARFQYTRFAENHKIKLPPMVEQEAVADVLGALDDKIALNDRIAEASEELAIALASKELWPNTTPLGSIVTWVREQAVPSELSAELVAHYSLPAFDSGQRPEIVRPSTIKSTKFLIESPVVLLSKLNPSTPRIWNVDPDQTKPALASTEFLVLRPTDSLSPAEIWVICNQTTFIQEISRKVTGTSNSHQRVKPQDLLATSVTDPRLIEASVRNKITSISNRARIARQEVTALVELRDVLLPKLMSGEIRVRDAEKAVEEAT